ncbi:potassium channel subfamily K member 1-like [Heterodontus francisci]|uniref:potassium channel subfamily K member 1-like n=1 Tax=Heterodontus francisci TaxID=7792 RepID=UPI00355C5A9D
MVEVSRRCSKSYFWMLMICFIAYALFGTFVFSALELPWEIQMRRDIDALKSKFLREHECLEELELDLFLQRVVTASNYGISALGNASDDRNWDLSSSLFFVSTVLTTTGYGHSVPLTNGGKTFCMLYSVLGIPVTLLLLTSFVQRLMFYVHWAPISYIHSQCGLSLHLAAWIHAIVIGSIVVSCFFLIPAAAFMALEEDWDYLESLYFCFISLSTIGLGDYVPGKSRYPSLQHLYKVGISCYLVIGLVALLVMLETFYKLQELQYFVHIIMDHPHKELNLGVSEQEVVITASNLDAAGCPEHDGNRGKGCRGPEVASTGKAAELSAEQ